MAATRAAGRTQVLATLAVLVTAAPSWTVLSAQQPYVPTLEDIARASALVKFWVDDGRIPGAVLSVRQRDSLVFQASYGWAQSHAFGGGQYSTEGRLDGRGVATLDDPVPMTLETVFDLASVTKVMASTVAVALLVDRGQLDTDAPVSAYLPDFRGGGKETITLEHLLTHRAGLSQWKPVYYHAANATDAYTYIRDLPLEWPVGAGRHYSDLGFMVLGVIVERVTGMSLEEFLRAELYGPLGLEATGFRGPSVEGGSSVVRSPDGAARRFAATSHGNPFEHRMVYDGDFGYRIEGDPESWSGWRRHTLSGEVNDGNAYHAFGGAAGHAGLFSTAEDVQILLGLWMAGGDSGGRRYLSEETIDRFLQSTGEGQALGWQLPMYAPEGAFGHTGFTGTFVLAVPESRLGIVLLTNRQNGGVDEETAYPDLDELQREVTRALTGAR